MLRCSQWLYVTGLRYSRARYDVNDSAPVSCAPRQINRWLSQYSALFGTLTAWLPDLCWNANHCRWCVARSLRMPEMQKLEMVLSHQQFVVALLAWTHIRIARYSVIDWLRICVLASDANHDFSEMLAGSEVIASVVGLPSKEYAVNDWLLCNGNVHSFEDSPVAGAP